MSAPTGRPSAHRPRYRLRAKVLLALVSAVATLLVGEGVTRTLSLAPAFLDLQPRTWRAPKGHARTFANAIGPKKGSEFRIVTFGGSTVAGWPIGRHLSFPTLLEQLLNNVTRTRFRVINLANVGLNATDVADLVAGASILQPDLYLVLSGHNEYANRMYIRTPPEPIYRFLSTSHFARTMASLFAADPTGFDSEVRIQDVLSMIDEVPMERLGKPILDNLPVRDYERGVHRDHYEVALRRVARAAKEQGVSLVFAEPASNLRDYSPYFSTAESSRAFAQGRTQLAQGLHDQAKESFLVATDADGGPQRMTRPMLRRLRLVCRDLDVPLIPIREELAREGQHGIPGFDVFIDHLHPNLNGHKHLARVCARFLIERGLVPTAGAPNWARGEKPLNRIQVTDAEKAAQQQASHFFMAVQYVAAGNLAGAEEHLLIAFHDYHSRDQATLLLLQKIYRSQGREKEISDLKKKL